jgi:hypothetical protein
LDEANELATGTGGGSRDINGKRRAEAKVEKLFFTMKRCALACISTGVSRPGFKDSDKQCLSALNGMT